MLTKGFYSILGDSPTPISWQKINLDGLKSNTQNWYKALTFIWIKSVIKSFIIIFFLTFINNLVMEVKP